MPTGSHVLTDASLTVGGTDLSSSIRSITTNFEVETQDATAMGDTVRGNNAGLENWSVTVEFHQNYDASSVDATLWSVKGSETQLVLKPSSGAVAATNPSYTGTALLQSYNPLDGAVGDQHMTPVTFVPSKGSVLTRATS